MLSSNNEKFLGHKNNPSPFTFPIGENPPSAIRSSTAPPAKLSALAQKALIPSLGANTTLNHKVQELNLTFSWEVAQMQALFNAIYSQGIATPADLTRIQSFYKQIDALDQALKEKDLSPSSRTHALQCLQQARQTLNEIESLAVKLSSCFPLQEQFDDYLGDLVDHCDVQDALMGMDAMKKTLIAFHALQNHFFSEDGAANKLLHECNDRQFRYLSWVVEDWVDALKEAMVCEFQTLSKELRAHPGDDDLLRQLDALWKQQKQIQQELENIAASTSSSSASLPANIHHSINQTIKVIGKQNEAISFFLKTHSGDKSLAPLSYGSEEWQLLVKQRSPVAKGMIHQITHPEEWSEKTKQVVHTLFIGMQLSQQLAPPLMGIFQSLWDPNRLKNLADNLQRQVFNAVSPEEHTKIEREVSALGNLLDQKYSLLQQQPALREHFSRRYPDIRPALDQAIDKQFGQLPPSREEVSQFLETYRIHRLAQVSSSPYKTLSLEQWWDLFQKGTEQQTQQTRSISQQKAIGDGEGVEPIQTSDASRLSGWVPSLIKTIGDFLGTFFPSDSPPSVSSDTPPSHSLFAFIESKTQEGQEALCLANEKIHHLDYMVKQNNSYPIVSLRSEVARLHREVTRHLAESPETGSLVELATWLQNVEDRCYAVRDLEERIAFLMKASQHALSAEDAELQRYGKKHENLIKQARLVEALQLPGVQVPIPKGIASDTIRAFLEKEAPELFTHWQALGQEFSAYQGSSPFLEQPTSKAHLKAIDQAIARAFGKTSISHWAPEELVVWLKSLEANGDYLMVRSTGAEDSRQTANAGGNVSKAYVSPQTAPFCEAVGDVVRSYFSYPSLQNRINAGLNPFAHELKLAVTAQPLIGEAVDGKTPPSQIPISLVLFTSEPLYVGGEKFRVMRLSATYGHGEGVVGNQGIASDTALILISEAKPDQLYVLYDNQAKPERLAPKRTSEGIHLAKTPNPPSLVNKPVLSSEWLSNLYTWGIIGEKFFDDEPTDMELVIKGGMLYPVQARPVNRPALLPTYLDTRKIAALPSNPIIRTLSAETLVPGKASVVIASKSEGILFAPTLEEAERLFHKGQHQIVIVTQPEPANSHPVVNFSALGIPCLVATDQDVQAFIAQANEKTPLVVCMQTATLHLWDSEKGEAKSFISNGFAVHPAKVAISLPAEAISLHGESSPVPQEVKDLILAVRSATTQKAATAALQQLRQNDWVNSAKTRQKELVDQMKSLPFVPKVARETVNILKELDKKLERAFDEAEAAWNRAEPTERLRPLFHAKVLENLLFGIPAKGGSLAQYSIVEAEPLSAQALALIQYQKHLSHPAHFAEILPEGFQVLTKETELLWQQFLLELEPLVEKGEIHQEKVVQLKTLVATLEHAGLLPTWFSFFFPASYRSGMNPEEKLNSILQTLPSEEQGTIEAILKKNDALDDLRKQIDLFSDPKTFEKGWAQLLDTCSSEMDISFLETTIKQNSPISGIFANKAMGELVDIFDTAIKTMKASTAWNEGEKVVLFKKMLKPYLALLRDWSTHLLSSSFAFHWQWPLNTYLEQLESLLNNMPIDDFTHLRPSPNFSVAAAILGSGTAFERHFPVNLEDMFTLIHQNLLVCIGDLENHSYTDQRIEQSALPISLKTAMKIMTPSAFGRAIQRLGMEITDKEVIINYNVPLRNHSGRISLLYDKNSGRVAFKAYLLGEARTRWPLIAEMGKILDIGGVFALTEPIRLGPQEIVFSWDIPDEGKLSAAVNEYKNMLEISLEWYLEVGALERLVENHFPTNPHQNPGLMKYLLQKPINASEIYNAYMLDVMQEGTEALERNGISVREVLNGVIYSDTYLKDKWIRYIKSGAAGKDAIIKNGSVDSENNILKWMATQLEYPDMLSETWQLLITHPNKLEREIGNSLVSSLILGEKEIPLIINIAKNALQSTKELLLDGALRVFQELFEKNHGFQEALDNAKIMIQNDAAPIRGRGIILFEMLAEKDQAHSEVLQSAQIALDDVNDVCLKALHLFKTLIDKGQYYSEALKAANKSFDVKNHADVRKQALDLFISLVGKGQAYSEAKEIANIAINDVDRLSINVRAAGLDLLRALVEQGQAYEEAIEAIKIIEATEKDHHASYYIDARKKVFPLYKALINQAQAYPEALKAANKALKNSLHNEAIDLFRALMDKGQAYEEAKEVADRACEDLQGGINDCQIGLKLYKTLVEKGQAYPEALKAANGAIKDRRFPEKEELALDLYQALVDQGQAYEEAKEAANQASGDYFLEIQQKGLSLYEALVKKGQAYPEAVEAINRNSKNVHLKKEVSNLYQALVDQGQVPPI
jgi:Pyruvate phosphate dikinase, AMP/ATP-binding domain